MRRFSCIRITAPAILSLPLSLGLGAFARCVGDPGSGEPRPDVAATASGGPGGGPGGPLSVEVPPGGAVATFAGGCFWCMERPFESVDGVRAVISGYTGGTEPNPTYRQVGSGSTGHAEAIRVIYDPARVSYEDLLRVFWRQIDPTDAGGQFVDRGRQYRPAIFTHDAEQRALAERTRDALAASGRFEAPIVVEITPAGPFYPAETDHQDFYRKHPERYRNYRDGSGRDAFLRKAWGPDAVDAHAAGEDGSASHDREDPSPRSPARPADADLRARLTPLQSRVTQGKATEPPFRNEYWDNERDGIYVDVVSGEPLFSSREKFHSGTGWPSFWKPLVTENIVERRDRGLFTSRTEVRSLRGDSHLGHVFDDGPAPTGLRYCINSAALRFIPAADLVAEGYGEFAPLFEE